MVHADRGASAVVESRRLSVLRRWITLVWVGLFCVAAAPPPYWSDHGVVAADHALASEAGAEILRKGGNAVDAAVATALAAGVVQPSSSGLGGGGFAVYGSGPDSMKTLDFREIAPEKSHPGLFLDAKGDVVPKASTKGGLAIGVPGEGRGLAHLLRSAGTMSFEEVAAPAIRLAEEGFVTGDLLLRVSEKKEMTDLLLKTLELMRK